MDALQPASVLLLIAAFGLAPVKAQACGLDHCPRPGPAIREAPFLAWSIEHTDLARTAPSSRYSQASLHARFPLASSWILGGHLPIGFLEVGTLGHWGMGNPMAYGEWQARPLTGHVLTLGLQVEFPLGDTRDGIASTHSMAMPFGAYALRWNRVFAQVSAAFAAKIPGWDFPSVEKGDDDNNHAAHAPEVSAIPHAPYEWQFRAMVGWFLPVFRLEPEVGISGARVVDAGGGGDKGYTALEGGLGLRPGTGLLLRIRGKSELDGPARFAWSTGLDMRLELPGRLGRKD